MGQLFDEEIARIYTLLRVLELLEAAKDKEPRLASLSFSLPGLPRCNRHTLPRLDPHLLREPRHLVRLCLPVRSEIVAFHSHAHFMYDEQARKQIDG